VYRYFLYFLPSLLLSCSPLETKPNYNSNTELVVTYYNKEVHRRSPYLSLAELEILTKQKKELIIIFSASWCSACKLTKKAISHADLKTKVYYLNIDENWVKKLALMFKIQAVPSMIHVRKDGDLASIKTGPGEIITYLLIKF
jgi:thioredoxin-related protein